MFYYVVNEIVLVLVVFYVIGFLWNVMCVWFVLEIDKCKILLNYICLKIFVFLKDFRFERFVFNCIDFNFVRGVEIVESLI